MAQLSRRISLSLADGRGMTPRQLEDLEAAGVDRGFRHLAAAQGLASALADSLEGFDRRVPEALTRLRDEATIRRLASRATLTRIGEVLDSEDIPWVAFKGPVIAARHRRPELREFNDLDILVSGAHLRATLDALDEAGMPTPTRNWAGLAAHGVGELPIDAGPLWVDLHWHLVGLARDRRTIRLDPVAMLERRRMVTVGTQEVPAFDPADELVHLAVHAGLGGAQRVTWLADVAALIRTDPPSWDTVVSRLAGTGVAQMVGQVLDRTGQELDADIPAATIEALVPGPALALRRRSDRSVPSLETQLVRAYSGLAVAVWRDRPWATLAHVGAVTHDRIQARRGRSIDWDVDAEDGPLYWGTTAGGDREKAAWLAWAAENGRWRS
ncbi:MAG: nucleotidyltransferase family protein [Actinomycetia bacterium]|nr:nucleotidyltransferase family protein [Actinomycetes bacterium]